MICRIPPRHPLHYQPYWIPTGEKWEDEEREKGHERERALPRRLKCLLVLVPVWGGRGRGPRPASE